MSNDLIRRVSENDSAGILDIYSYYIENTVTTFEIETPALDSFAEKIKSISEVYSFFVYTSDDVIIGYAYASKHHERAAYCYDVDVSVYVKNDMCNKGIGSKLYNTLFDELVAQNYYNAYALIALPNEGSIALHHKFGFSEIGTHKKTGYKFGQWIDVLWLEKTIKDHNEISVDIDSNGIITA